MKNLTSITEHSDWLFSQRISTDEKWFLHRQRVDFGKQPLALWMFIPCKLVDSVWVVLEEKKPFQDNYFEFQEARERCLFEGFKYNDGYLINGMNCINTKLHQTIEDLVKYNLELTPAAQI